MTVDEFPQAQVLGEGHRKEQAGIGHQAVVIKDDADAVGLLQWLHLLGATAASMIKYEDRHD